RGATDQIRIRRQPQGREGPGPLHSRGGTAARRQGGRMKFLKLFLFFFCATAFAQDYPSRPVTVIVPFSSGSASDVIARIVLERMSTSVGQRFVVDNRPAAGGMVATQAASKAEPDGYTLVMGA